MFSTPSHKIYLKCFAQNQQNLDINVRWIPLTYPQEYKGRDEGREGGREGRWKGGRKEGEEERKRKKRKNSILPARIRRNSSITWTH